MTTIRRSHLVRIANNVCRANHCWSETWATLVALHPSSRRRPLRLDRKRRWTQYGRLGLPGAGRKSDDPSFIACSITAAAT